SSQSKESPDRVSMPFRSHASFSHREPRRPQRSYRGSISCAKAFVRIQRSGFHWFVRRGKLPFALSIVPTSQGLRRGQGALKRSDGGLVLVVALPMNTREGIEKFAILAVFSAKSFTRARSPFTVRH